MAGEYATAGAAPTSANVVVSDTRKMPLATYPLCVNDTIRPYVEFTNGGVGVLAFQVTRNAPPARSELNVAVGNCPTPLASGHSSNGPVIAAPFAPTTVPMTPP
jgi:hypothetical protein